jgi:biopolymer transport protein ExbB/TolQ
MLFEFLGHADYFFLAGAALWGLFNLHLVWTLVGRLRFKNEAAQDAFLDSIAPDLERGDYAAVQAKCEGDRRAIPMLVDIAMQNADMEPQALHDLVSDRFQYDAIAQIDASTAWVSTIIKLAPMLGLIGTVAGMMGAFQTLEEATTSEPTKQLLRDIRIALDHTLIGLLITVSLLVAMGVVNNRIKDMEELAGFGLNRFFQMFEASRQGEYRETARR